ncbi:uncharacterized protein MONOS_1828 [Monocercomonoides exilis]|uniref:uncharacterized protein n=1 Tax=Monocercomonoides exilis TaxID=2049356 RepID=UPI003559945A|nr:hypothetical protein MONOS_1828 [Monocercomonoides exilis]|eukprot:MONOS_1828.1-p1 / transcript=MONOS_1828.1 / gene=MONOS_1828 / organism=Monocercomonoides_exilis_PA203 / gene_product=unspecified product / transcript_product=unspecified product / location=Mono_scaffold00034:141474-141716(-) / protein_length=81 / sequence_SO=supercontig / SO=protein_coding / is_pseudo=false
MTTAIESSEWSSMRMGMLLALKRKCRWITWTSSVGNPSAAMPTAADANADPRQGDASYGTGASEQVVRREYIFLNKWQQQ